MNLFKRIMGNESKEAGMKSEAPSSEGKKRVHNLIILDESGSMMSIYKPALDGVNETLQTIRMAEDDHPDQDHFVTLVAFDTGHYNQIYSNVPAAKTTDITMKQYKPCGGTPLYDAMGRAIMSLSVTARDEDIVLVTIITDGYENASREYTGKAIKQLVTKMRNNGWVFTYIGANQDVETVAESMAINNRMSFDACAVGTNAMFEAEMKARKKFFDRVSNEPEADLSEDYFQK